MNIQRRIYKFSETKEEIQNRISNLANESDLIGRWVNETNFILRNKRAVPLFCLHGNIDETVEKGKLKVAVTADYKYLLLYTLPLTCTLYGIWKSTEDLEKGALLIFTGISLMILVFAFASSLVHRLKKSFKESFNIM